MKPGASVRVMAGICRGKNCAHFLPEGVYVIARILKVKK